MISNFKSNPKHFWKYVSNTTRVHAEIGKLKLPDGSLTSNDYETTEALNEYFTSVFTREDLSQLPSLESIIFSDSLSSIAIIPEEVFSKLSNLIRINLVGWICVTQGYFMKLRYVSHSI